MDDEAVREVEEALRSVWSTGGRSFVTVEDARDDARFVQYIDGQLNVAWPFDEAPEARLPGLPQGAFVLSWTPHGTAILAVGDLLADDVAALVVRLLRSLLGARGIVCRTDSDR